MSRTLQLQCSGMNYITAETVSPPDLSSTHFPSYPPMFYSLPSRSHPPPLFLPSLPTHLLALPLPSSPTQQRVDRNVTVKGAGGDQARITRTPLDIKAPLGGGGDLVHNLRGGWGVGEVPCMGGCTFDSE